MMPAVESRTAKVGRIAARVATIVLALAAVAVKLSVDKAMAELAEAKAHHPPTSPWPLERLAARHGHDGTRDV